MCGTCQELQSMIFGGGLHVAGRRKRRTGEGFRMVSGLGGGLGVRTQEAKDWTLVKVSPLTVCTISWTPLTKGHTAPVWLNGLAGHLLKEWLSQKDLDGGPPLQLIEWKGTVSCSISGGHKAEPNLLCCPISWEAEEYNSCKIGENGAGGLSLVSVLPHRSIHSMYKIFHTSIGFLDSVETYPLASLLTYVGYVWECSINGFGFFNDTYNYLDKL
ncbi:uncharacterized protein LOC122890220 [Neovison vison]|uniref:uncharacterized protein LOC122890220 n=1 Tax=Neovison vison TaxID=452646 RepID=UPI001CF09EEE|nr:uncharacterized protein LOC122890220 [Neogale vison]